MREVREITDYAEWDRLVELSEQGTVFSTTKWMSLFDKPFKLYGVYKNDNLIGGIGGFDDYTPLTPFQGILVGSYDGKYVGLMSLHNEIAEALMDVLPSEFYNHYTYPDIRPFLWKGYQAIVKYTYVVKPDWNELTKHTRYEISHCLETDRSMMLNEFYILYYQTFFRKHLPIPVSFELILKITQMISCEVYATNESAVLLISDSKRSYYILGASRGEGTSSFCLWEAIKNKKEVDLVGCNNREIGHFKKGFGGKLHAYYGIKTKV